MITEKNLKDIIAQTKSGALEWMRTENTPCYDCETEDFGVIVCRYNNDGEPTISISFTNNWGNIYAESEFNNSKSDKDFFNELNEFYDKVEQCAIMEYL